MPSNFGGDNTDPAYNPRRLRVRKKNVRAAARRRVAVARRRVAVADLREARGALHSDLRQLNDSLERLEKQNVEWTKTLRVMRRSKALLLDELARVNRKLSDVLS